METLSTEVELNDTIGSQGDVLTNSASKGDKSKDNDESIINSTQTNAGSIIQEDINEDNVDSNTENETTEEDLFHLNYNDTPLGKIYRHIKRKSSVPLSHLKTYR